MVVSTTDRIVLEDKDPADTVVVEQVAAFVAALGTAAFVVAA